MLLMKDVNQQTYQTMGEGTHSNQEKWRGRWPTILWILMKMMGIYHHERVVRGGKCYSCYLKEVTSGAENWSLDEDEKSVIEPLCLHYEYDGPHWCMKDERNVETLQDNVTGNCETCQIMWWNHQGEVQRYSDEVIGLCSWNHRKSKFASIATLLVLVVCNGFMWFSVLKLWGKTEEQLSFILYASYVMCLSVFLGMIICSQIRSYCGNQIVSPLYWALTLNVRFIVRRLQFFDLERKGIPGKWFLATCLIWTCILSLEQFIAEIILIERPSTEEKIRVCADAIVLIVWGIFTYFIYVMRLSFQRQFMLCLRYIKQKEGDFGISQNIITNVLSDFKCFSKFTTLYTAAIISLNVLHATVFISIQYHLNSGCMWDNKRVLKINKAIIILSAIVAFVALTLFANGGLDLNYISNFFLHGIVSMKQFRNDNFCTLFQHARQILKLQTSWGVNLTLIGSILGIFLAMSIAEVQDIYGFGDEYFGNCSTTNTTQVNPMA